MTTLATDEDGVTITAAWPADPHATAVISNITAYQWDQDRAGIYLLFGHVGLPVWLTEADRTRWKAQNPDGVVPVTPVGTFYMNKARAVDFCTELAKHLGLEVEAESEPNDAD